MDEQVTAESLPSFSASAVLIDMDGTFTPTIELGDYFSDILCQLVADKQGLSTSQAEKAIRNVFDLGNELPSSVHFDSLNICFDDYWQELMRWQQQHFAAYEDAVEMIRCLHAMGVRMYPGTSNGSLSCRAKLARAGLADQSSCIYLTELFGGSEVHPQGKTGPEFFRALLRKIDCRPDEVLMVGDDVKADFGYASQAGIDQIVIVRRDQQLDWTQPQNGPVFVKSLAIVPKMLKNQE